MQRSANAEAEAEAEAKKAARSVNLVINSRLSTPSTRLTVLGRFMLEAIDTSRVSRTWCPLFACLFCLMGRWMSGDVLFHELSAVHKIKTFGSSHMVGLFASHTTFICAVMAESRICY
jgi:hypothetical protein